MAGISSGIELFPVGHALDAIKTRQQVSNNTIMQATTSLYRKGGISEFYKGLFHNGAIAPTKNAARWVMMDSLNKFYDDVLPKSTASVLHPFFVSATLSAGESLPISIFEKLKTYNMTKDGHMTSMQMLKREGASRLLDGWSAVFFKQFVSWTSYLVAYQQLTRWAVIGSGEQPLSIGQEMLVGASAGAVNVLATSPFDAIKTQLQKADSIKATSLYDAVSLHHRTYGFKGFFKGLPIRMVRNVWWAMIVLPIMHRMGIIKSA